MVKRKRSSRKRTSRRNLPRQLGAASGLRQRLAEGTASRIAEWKRSYVQKYGASAAALVNAGEEAVARMHTLLDEGLTKKQAYTETVALFGKDPQPVADFADDVAHSFYLLVRDHGFTASDAAIATRRGVTAAVANTRRRRKRRSR